MHRRKRCTARLLYLVRMRPTQFVAAVGVCIVLSACGSSGPRPAPSPSPDTAQVETKPVERPVPSTVITEPSPPPAPFAAFAGRRLAVFPLQRIASDDSAALAASAATVRPRAAALDSALTRVLTERGLESQWALPPAVSRGAAREVMNRVDPRALAVTGLTPSRRANDVDLRDPLASQLRSIVAMVDARYALVPVEVRLRGPAGQRVATLRLALLDARMSTVLTLPDVSGTPASSEAAALTTLAARIADLFVAP
jgi:hypothetical protein